jgi:uncharacterized protein YjbJ (UPF0337 family)
MKPNTRDNVEGTIREVNGNFKEATGKPDQRIHNSVERSTGEY